MIQLQNQSLFQKIYSYKNYLITNCIMNFNLTSESFELYENNTFSNNISISTNFTPDFCTFLDQKEENRTGIFTTEIDEILYNKINIHDCLFYQINNLNNKSPLYLNKYFVELSLCNAEFYSCVSSSAMIYMDSPLSLYANNFAIYNCSTSKQYSFYIEDLIGNATISYGSIDKNSVLKDLAASFYFIKEINSFTQNKINYTSSIFASNPFVVTHIDNYYCSEIVIFNNTCPKYALMHIYYAMNSCQFHYTNFLNNNCTSQDSGRYIIDFSTHEGFNLSFNNVYFKENPGFTSEFFMKDGLLNNTNFVDCYTDFFHDSYTYLKNFTENIKMPILNTFEPYQYPNFPNENPKKSNLYLWIIISISSILFVGLILGVIYVIHTRRKYRKYESDLELTRSIINEFG